MSVIERLMVGIDSNCALLMLVEAPVFSPANLEELPTTTSSSKSLVSSLMTMFML